MKKFFSLAAAAALVGGIVMTKPAVTHAGTVSVNGNTQVTLYGFTYAEFGWAKKTTGGAEVSNMADSTATKTSFSTNVGPTRIGFKFNNQDANLCGKIEGDFDYDGKLFRIRKAYVKHNLGNFYVLIGQDDVLENYGGTISISDTSPAGFDGIARAPEVKLGSTLDLGSAQLNLALAFEDIGSNVVSSGTESAAADGYMKVSRTSFPATAARVTTQIDTGIGAPANIYAWGSMIPVYLDSEDGSITNKSKTSYGFGAGFTLPVSMVTIGANYRYSKGATGYDGLSDYEPSSYYYVGNDIKATKFMAYNVNAVISPMPNISVGLEYDYAQYKNNDAFNGKKPKVYTYLINTSINTTKYTTLSVEWRHIKAKKFESSGLGGASDSMSGNQFSMIYTYSF